jgi:hypothetical protein
VSDHRWLLDLQRCDTLRYVDALQRVAKVAQTLPNARALYRFGNIGCPGVSDLDALLVLTTPPTRALASRIDDVTVGLSGDPYLWTHPVFAVSEDAFSLMQWIHPSRTHHLVWGRSCDVHSPPREARGWLDVADYHDFTLSVHFGLDSLRRPREHSLRSALMLLTSLKHSLEGAARITGEASPPICAEIEALRAQCAAEGERTVTADLQELLEEGRRELNTADQAVWRTLLQRKVAREDVRFVCQELLGHAVRFGPPGRQAGFMCPGDVRLVPSYWQIASTYARARGHLGRFHRALYPVRADSGSLASSLESALLMRVGVAERLFRWLGDTGFKLLAPLASGYQTPTPVAWRIARRLRSLRRHLGV